MLPGVSAILERHTGMISPNKRPAQRRRPHGPALGHDAQMSGTPIPEFLIDDIPPPAAVRASEAARGFTAGNGYIPGLIVDRLA
jgi:hypothetical protein